MVMVVKRIIVAALPEQSVQARWAPDASMR